MADLVATAVTVGLALHLGAAEGRAGVAHMLVVTLAEGLVVPHQAMGVWPAVCPVTGIHTLPVAAAVSGTGKRVQAIPVCPTFVRALAALGVRVSHLTARTGALVGARSVGAGGRGVTNLVVTLIDILASTWCADKSCCTDAVASLADLPWPAILLLVTAWLAGGVEADLTLETVLIGVTHLDTDIFQALLSLGTVGVDVTLPVTHTTPAVMICWTNI